MNVVEQLLNLGRPGLLVSVRNAEEAIAALAGGADVIDVKEPLHGPLGKADALIVDEVVRVVDGRAPVTVAAGELLDWNNEHAPHGFELPAAVSLVKVGLAGCGAVRDWDTRWKRFVTAAGSEANGANRTVAAVYADWRAAGAPPPDAIHSAAVEIGCPALLVDTWDKASGHLFEHWPPDDLQSFVERVRAGGRVIVLAGSLRGRKLLAAAQLGPHLVGVRGAACEGDRSGRISSHRVSRLRQLLASGATAHRPADECKKLNLEFRLRHKKFS